MTLRSGILSALILMSAFIRLSAQQKDSQTDSLVRLLSAQSLELIEKDGVDYRKVTGPARFLHNDTYLICDTALWNTKTQEIFAINNVKILQDQTELTGDRLTYYIDRNLAEFRGALVQLEDKDHNILRTEYLDYNTRDSVGVFFNGGSMRDKDGQIIESKTGTYDSKTKTFTFTNNVNMFTDSVFVKSTTITYDAGRNIATFGFATDTWSEDNMLSSNAGWYDRNREIFLFRNNVHGMSPTQEGWADSLYYFRNTGNIELLGNAQITDTTKDMSAMAGRIMYTDSSSRIVMTREPVVVGILKSETAPQDTVYFGADTLIAQTRMMFEINEREKQEAKTRLDGLSVDAVQTYRRKAAAAAAEAAAKAAENDPNRPKPHHGKPGNSPSGPETSQSVSNSAAKTSRESSSMVSGNPVPDRKDSLAVSSDSLSVQSDSLSIPSDSLSVRSDSLSVSSDSLSVGTDTTAMIQADSSKVNFITALHKVRLYKGDMQIACDSLEYNDLDSLIRMYRDPIVWNEGSRQYSADSLYAVIKNGTLQKASLMSNAFIIVQEDSAYFDQIRATEMLAYFDSTGSLSRFDALGDASAIFYLQEDSVYATVNKSEAKMLYATFVKGNLDRVYYFESTKNDGYPLAQMRPDERVIKGFKWSPEIRPKGPHDISSLDLRNSERLNYEAHPRTSFEFTDKYFPGYMPGIMEQIKKGKLAKSKSKQQNRAAHDAEHIQDLQDSSKITSDSTLVAIKDSVSISSPDSLQVDTVAVADSLHSTTSMKSDKELKAEQRAARQALREAKWARLDSLDAAKSKAREEKKAARLRAKKLKILRSLDQEEQKNARRLERYKERYLKRKVRDEEKSLHKAEAIKRKTIVDAVDDARQIVSDNVQ